MAGKSGSSKKQGTKAKAPRSAKPRQSAPQPQQQPYEDRSLLREVLGVVTMGAGVLLAYFCFAGGDTAESVLRVLRGLAGSLFIAIPLLVVWIGALITFAGKERKVRPGRLALSLLLPLIFAAIWHVFYADGILATMRLYNFGNFLSRSYLYQKGGAGVLGALLSWPVYYLMMRTSVFGSVLVLGILLVADLTLLRKISLRRLGGRVKQSYDVYVEHARQRADEKRQAAEQRMQAMVVPTVYATPGGAPAVDGPAKPVRLKPAPRAKLPDSDDLENWDVPKNPAPVRSRAAANGREMVIERIRPDDPLPGEPRVRPVASETAGPDVPHFLAKRRPKGAKPEPLNVKEPEPLYRPEPEELPPQPDGSEVAESAPGEVRGQAEFTGGDWQEVKLGDEALTYGESVKPAPQAEPEPPFEPTTPVRKEKRPVIIAKSVKKPPVPKKPEPEVFKPETDGYNYPPIDLLASAQPSQARNREQSDEFKGKKLIDALASFGISTRLIGIAHGPTVTRFELSPAAGVKVSRITALADDIALNLAAVSVRIEAPIPGKAAVGVEVPNDTIEVVPLRDVLESGEARKNPSRLAMALGRDNAGRYIVADLAKMPHVLIAGTTGSGKSVCINCIVCSILYRSTPDEVKMIMIDPKVVELSCYNGIPHLLVPVVTDPKKAAGALDWAVSEMSGRYKKFAELGVRDIKGYNMHRPEGEPAMPQIVIIIDELADLMAVAPRDVEDSIARLAQLARAAGINLVIATQRPSVNIITGVIKANIPARIAFMVASFVDSRTILDVGGAEKLLGRGDMLYAPSDSNKPIRIQGAWVSDDEVHDVVSYVKVRHETTYDAEVIELLENTQLSDAAKDEAKEAYDELLPQAIELVIDAGQASTSMIQRRLRIGYSRAGWLMDQMEKRGVVSPADGAKPRSVLITREQFKLMFDDK
jgi:DNA segregation ATPase FtsK/SpoIIIE-like protein